MHGMFHKEKCILILYSFTFLKRRKESEDYDIAGASVPGKPQTFPNHHDNKNSSYWSVVEKVSINSPIFIVSGFIESYAPLWFRFQVKFNSLELD